jgi:hypothetical protein
MNMVFSFGDCSSLEGVRFDGLTGREYVISTKDALNVMRVRNPAIAFSQDTDAGAYDEVPDEDYEQMHHMVDAIKELWRYPGELGESGVQDEMNILMLLANAIELVSRQDVELRRYRGKQG